MKNSFFAFLKKNKKAVIMPTVIMIAICFVVTLALSVSNIITEPKIEELEKAAEAAALKSVMPAESYDKKTFKEKDNATEYYEAISGGKTIGYIFTVTESGYGGDIKVMTAVLPDLSVKAVSILDVSNETVGLGQNTAEEKFYSQFSGKTEKISVVKSGADQNKNEINAVTGATISSRAVTRAVNTAIDNAAKIVGENNTEKEGADE